jgi:hypothetical protein
MLGLALALVLSAPPRIAVMPVVPGDAISEKAAASLTDQLAAEVRRQGGGEVLTPRDVPAAVAPDKLKLAQGCATDPGMAEVATSIGAERLVVPEVSKLGDSLLLHVRILDARSVRALSISDRRFRRGSFDDLLDVLPAVVRELLRGAEGVASVSDKFVLHYHREDGRYEASLYTWESSEPGTDLRRSVPVSWDSRVPTVEADGHDDFGVLWLIPAARFRNGRVNFQIQQGGIWDECVRISYKPANPVTYSSMQPDLGPAQFWLLSDGREAWINVPECEIYPTLDRALKAQRKRPRGK